MVVVLVTSMRWHWDLSWTRLCRKQHCWQQHSVSNIFWINLLSLNYNPLKYSKSNTQNRHYSKRRAYGVLVFSESWLNHDTNSSDIQIEHILLPFRSERQGRSGGRIAIYVSKTLSCKRRSGLILLGVESVWIQIQVKSKTVLIGEFYRLPNSGRDYFELIKGSVDTACNTNIVITSDFNIDMSKDNNNEIKEMLEYSLNQLISEPMHLAEHSSAITDLTLVRNNYNVLTSGVADHFMADYTRYHCPIIAALKFTRPHTPSFEEKNGTTD